MILGIEHIGLVVHEHRRAADWYREHCGFEHAGHSADGKAAFVRDPVGGMLFELIGSGEIEPLDARVNHPLQCHIALKTNDFEHDKAALIAAGAEFVATNIDTVDAKVCTLKCPFGLYLQLACRQLKTEKNS